MTSLLRRALPAGVLLTTLISSAPSQTPAPAKPKPPAALKWRVQKLFEDNNEGCAVADFKFNDWLGMRGGKVKTVFGLYTDSQDLAFLHTWAILPQSLYPLDLRSSTIAHLGGDVYGERPLPKNLGSIAYTAYAGSRFVDKYGGYRNAAAQAAGFAAAADRVMMSMGDSDEYVGTPPAPRTRRFPAVAVGSAMVGS